MFGSAEDIILYFPVKLGEIGAIPRHPYKQVAITLRMSLGIL